MNGDGTTMYKMRPIITLPATFTHTDAMYRMRKIYEDHDDRCRRHDANTDAKMPDDVVTEQKPSLSYNMLEARQENILSQLAMLKKQVFALCNFLKQSNQVENIEKDVSIKKPDHIELVVYANPDRPPYSILALQKLWKDTDIRVTTYVHSTFDKVLSVPAFSKIVNPNAENIINLSLIWANVNDMEVVTGIDSYRIIGEVNFLRYLSRLTDMHNYENTCMQPHVLDFTLDMISCLHSAAGREKELPIDKFEKLSDSTEFTIADIALWSVVKQFSLLPASLASRGWYEACEKAFLDKN